MKREADPEKMVDELAKSFEGALALAIVVMAYMTEEKRAESVGRICEWMRETADNIESNGLTV